MGYVPTLSGDFYLALVNTDFFLHSALSDITILVQPNVLSAKYVMKTYDDAFVRVDEILSSLPSSTYQSWTAVWPCQF
jgi:hypothetical protein